MTVVLPRLTEVLTETGVELPLPTKIIIAVSGVFVHSYSYLIIALAVIIAIFVILVRTKTGKRLKDRIIFQIPVLGKLSQMVYLSRFTRSLSTLLVGGLPIISALKITAEVTGSNLYKKIILRSAKEVESGKSIASVFLQSKDIPRSLSHLLVVGERTGKLDEVLSRMADFYTREVDRTLANLVSLLEPMIIIFLGAVVGFIAMAVIMPMYSLTTSI